MKEKLTRNIGLKVLSVILAALLWLIITNVDDPIETKDFSNVQVEILNEDAINSLNEVYEITEGKTIDFTVKARRSIKDNLTVSDFSVTADFSELSDVNALPIKIKCLKYGADQVTVTDREYKVMKVNLEEVAEKNFKVDVVQTGEPAEGYYVAEKTANTILKVSGPKTKIESIAEIIVKVDVSGLAGSFRTYEEPIARDKNGKNIDASNLKFSDNSVTVNINMFKTKDIDLLVTASGKPADGYAMTSVEYEPKKVEVAGDYEALSSIQSLTIDESVEGATQNIEKEVNLQEQLPKGLILVGDNQTAVVKINIEKAQTKEMQIDPGDIKVRNKPDNLEVEYLSSGPIMVKVTGPVAKVADLTSDDAKLFIDLTGYTRGTYYVSLAIDDSLYSTLLNNPKVRISLK